MYMKEEEEMKSVSQCHQISCSRGKPIERHLPVVEVMAIMWMLDILKFYHLIHLENILKTVLEVPFLFRQVFVRCLLR
jgi:hypothetical protein